jgi:hypothetical protein
MVWIVNAKVIEIYQVKVKVNDGLSDVIDFRKILKMRIGLLSEGSTI